MELKMVYSLKRESGYTSTFAGGDEGTADGTGTAARFNGPCGITTTGRYLYVADWGNNRIRKIKL